MTQGKDDMVLFVRRENWDKSDDSKTWSFDNAINRRFKYEDQESSTTAIVGILPSPLILSRFESADDKNADVIAGCHNFESLGDASPRRSQTNERFDKLVFPRLRLTREKQMHHQISQRMSDEYDGSVAILGVSVLDKNF